MYVVDFKKPSNGLLLGLVNFDNKDNPDWEDILLEDVILVQPPEAQPQGSAKNTKTIIRTKKDEFTVRDVEVFYNRIDINYLFSAVGLFVQELNLDEDGEGGFLLNQKTFDEINRKYGLNFTSEDFSMYRDGERYAVRSIEDSLAYIGNRDINIIPSLATRVATTALDGFFVINHENMWVLSFTEAYPVNSIYTTASAFDDPNHTVGGKWVKTPVNNVTPDEAYFMNLPYGYIVNLVTPPDRSEHFVMIDLGAGSSYNEGYAVETDEGWKVTYEPSREFDKVAPYHPTGSYLLIHRAAGDVNTGEPIYRWTRVE